jgi:stage II sporulation protein D
MRIAGRIIILCCAVLALASAIGASSASAQSRVQYWLEGRGWGHNLGMSQYGANGYAEHGWTSDQIISHYFTGTVVAPRPTDGPTSLRVLLQSHLAPAKVLMLSDGIIRQGTATLAVTSGDVVEMRSIGAFLVVTRVRTDAKNEIVTGASAADATIVPNVDGGVRTLFRNDNGQLLNSYRGTLTGHRFEGEVSVFNTVPFESYLRGVVGDEMPPSWQAEALKAQAIAARSYALTHLRTGFNWFDLYSDTRSQVYNGIGAEDKRTDAAIAATDGMVARVGGTGGDVAETYFFSTSAGRTASNEQVWGSSPVSYLRSVPSPYETSSPKFLWKGDDLKRYTPAQLGAALGVSGFRRAAETRYPNGFAQDVIIVTKSGSVSKSASSVQAKLGLNSTFFRFSYLSILAPNAVPAGAYVKLTGRVPMGGTTKLVLVQNGATRIVTLKPVGPLGAWTVRTRVAQNLTASLVRANVVGPRIVVVAGDV